MQANLIKVDLDARHIHFIVGRRVDELVFRSEEAERLVDMLQKAVNQLTQIREVNCSIADHVEDQKKFNVYQEKGKVVVRFHHSDRISFKTYMGFANFVMSLRVATQDAKLFKDAGLILDYTPDGLVKRAHDIDSNTTRIIR